VRENQPIERVYPRMGLLLRKIRIRQGIGIRELERRTKLSRGFLSEFERGRRRIAVHNLVKIAQEIGTVRWIVLKTFERIREPQ